MARERAAPKARQQPKVDIEQLRAQDAVRHEDDEGHLGHRHRPDVDEFNRASIAAMARAVHSRHDRRDQHDEHVVDAKRDRVSFRALFRDGSGNRSPIG